jgi:hypothetical protein
MSVNSLKALKKSLENWAQIIHISQTMCITLLGQMHVHI